MRVVIQRVSRASVSVSGEMIASIEGGLLLLVGVGHADTRTDAERLARRCAELRIFPDRDDRLNLSLLDVGGEALVVSQFTLLADTHKGRRPNFTQAAPPETGEASVPVVLDHGAKLERACAPQRPSI